MGRGAREMVLDVVNKFRCRNTGRGIYKLARFILALSRHFNNGSHCVSDIKIRSLCPISGSNEAAKDMKCISFPNLALSTLLALMNVLVTFNAHLSLSDTLRIDSPSFLFFTPFFPVSHCLVLYYAIRFTFLYLHLVLMKSI